MLAASVQAIALLGGDVEPMALILSAYQFEVDVKRS